MNTTFTMDELDTAINNLKLSSAPGPDGVPASFLKRYWPIIRLPIRNCFHNYKESGKLPKDYLTACLKLIPKKSDPKVLKIWRLITILNSK